MFLQIWKDSITEGVPIAYRRPIYNLLAQFTVKAGVQR